MRMLKKLLLAGAFIGVLGSFGFAREAKAADKIQSVSFTNNKATVTFDDVVSANKVRFYLENVAIADVDVVSANKTAEKTDVKATVNATTFPDSLTTLKTLKAEALSSNGITLDSKTADATSPLYKLSVSVSGIGGTVSLDDGAYSASASTYDYTSAGGGSSHKIAAKADNKYVFTKWSGAATGDANPLTSIYVADGGSNYTANFTSTSYGQAVLIVKYNGKTYYSTDTAVITMKVGETISFGYSKPSSQATGKASIDVDQDATYLSKTGTSTSSVTYTAVRKTEEDGFPVSVTAVASTDADFDDSETIEIFVEGSSVGGRINFSDFKNYITEGYTLEFTVKTNDQSAISSMAWDASTGGDYVDSYTVENTSNAYEKKVKIKFKGEKLDKGTNSATVKVRCKINGASGYSTIDNDTDTEKEITVYSNPTNSYNNSDRTMSYKVPAKVNTGTESGKDSNLSYTQDTVSEVKGIRINVLLNDNILGTTTTAASKGTGATVEASTMESIITNLGNSGKFTGDCTVVFRAYPSDSSGNCNKKVYHDTYAKVYKVVLRPGQSATAGSKTANAYALPIAMIAQRNTGATTTTATTTTAAGKEYVLYGLEGQTLTAPAGVTDLVDSNGNAVTKIVVSADANKNVYTYASTASASSREGLDKVPKTGQSNVFVYVMAVVICGAVGYGLYVYNKKSRKSI